MHAEMRSTRETDDRFPPENDKPRRVKCTANLDTDGIISKFAYRELDNFESLPSWGQWCSAWSCVRIVVFLVVNGGVVHGLGFES
jgi:hypothetical protein